MFIWRGISLQNFNRCALLICDNLMGLLMGVLILLHAETPLLHKSFICRATGWRSCHYCNCCFPSNSADASGKVFFLSENDNKYDYQGRDKRQSCLVVYNSVPVSLVLAKKKKQQLLSFMNLRRVSKWWKQTLTKEQSCSLNVSIMLLLYCIHKMFGENILAKVP